MDPSRTPSASSNEKVFSAPLVAALRAPGSPRLMYSNEPLRDPDFPLFRFEKVVATPHIGYVTREEYETQFTDIFDQIVNYAAGSPINVVNPDVLPETLPRD